jgi:aryl-alcohol dehydrogenase-like predicted oxidoreductase
MRMRYQTLGNSGLRVSELSLGTMTFGEDWGWGADREQAQGQLETYTEAGGNFLDTANVYTGGTAEKWIGEMVSQDGDRYIIATKYTLATSQSDPNRAGNHRKNMHRALKKSLQRLGTDHIDLYWVHMWDPHTPAHEVLRGLDDLVSQGKIHHIGISDAPAWVVSRLVTLAEERGMAPPIAIQLQYALSRRTPERELLPMAHHLGLGVTAWGTLGRGILTGKYHDQPPKEGGKRRLDIQNEKVTEHEAHIAATVQEIAQEADATPAQIATRWVLDREERIIPILGATKAAQLQETLGALEIRLSDDQKKRLEEASRIDMGFPTEFLETPRIKKMVQGAYLDNQRAPDPRWN